MNNQLQSGDVPLQNIPTGWMVRLPSLGVMLLAAILVERCLRTARLRSQDSAGASMVVTVGRGLTSGAVLAAPASPGARAGNVVSRPCDLLAGLLFVAGAVCVRQRVKAGTGSKDFFFFQAEDGIRDVAVTGVQTCALPI